MKRGFTLIETMVAIVMALIITSVALSLLVQISRIQLRDSIMQSLKREGQFIGLTLTSSLRVAGFGVPRGSDINFGVATTTALLTATPTAVGILGDAPAPGTQYNTFGILHTRNFDEPSDPTSVHRDRFSFHNENNGSCVPLGCDTADTSVFFPGESGCDTTALYDDRVCPWGLRRLESGDRYQIVAGDGGWTGGSMGPSPGLVSIPAPAAPDDWFTDDAILLDTGVDYDDVLGVWGNSGPGDAPTNTPGIGWVTTLDRIYFYRRGTAAPYQLIRRQCWGDPRFDEANFILANGDLPPNPQAATNFNDRPAPTIANRDSRNGNPGPSLRMSLPHRGRPPRSHDAAPKAAMGTSQIRGALRGETAMARGETLIRPNRLAMRYPGRCDADGARRVPRLGEVFCSARTAASR